jgi:hypothetical protein
MDAKISILVTSTALFIMAGMIGYLYWQQTKVMQHIQALSALVSANFMHHHQPVLEPEAEPEPETEPQPEPELEETVQPEVTLSTPLLPEDDRVSVEHVDGPAEPDVDDLQKKTAAELKELLTKKGIPFGKRDPKTSLLELLKASS